MVNKTITLQLFNLTALYSVELKVSNLKRLGKIKYSSLVPKRDTCIRQASVGRELQSSGAISESVL